MRLGIVPYLNCLPLIDGLDCEIYKAPPSHLPKLAKQDDIVLAPIVTAFVDPNWHLLEGVGIGSFGSVETVKLFFKNEDINIQNIKTICADSESETSVALLKVLLVKKYERENIAFIHAQDESCEGNLLIGDKVWNYEQKEADTFCVDLGEEWTEWTELPFVYACWMTKNLEIGMEWKSKLIAQAKKNQNRLEELAPNPNILRYWQRLRYELGPQQKEAIQLFQKYWASIEKKPTLQLNWIV